MYRPIGVRFDS